MITKCKYCGRPMSSILEYNKKKDLINKTKLPRWANPNGDCCWQCFCTWFDRTQKEEIINNGATPQEARSVLPNSIKTEVVITTNYREWRHFFNLRAARATGPAHPQMEELTVPLLRELCGLIPEVFDDIYGKWLSQ